VARRGNGKTARWQDGNWIVDCRLLLEEYFFKQQATIINHPCPLAG